MHQTKILITVSNLNLTSGVSAFWNSLFQAFKTYKDIQFVPLEIGGHGRNIIGPLVDQWKFHQAISSDIDLTLLNPSLLNRSFFRDGLFAKQLIRKELPFVVFFHGWELDFEKEVDKKHINFFLNSFGKAQKIFVLSQDFKNKIYQWGYKGDIIVETTNADAQLTKNFSILERKKVWKQSETIKILYLARLIKEKGAFELLEAFNELQKKFDNLELIIAGDGEDFIELQQLAEGKKGVTLTGDIRGEEKIKLFKKSHIYALPSYYGEGLPTSVLEAMLFGLPVITSEVGGLKDFFQDKKMGYKVEPKNVNQLVEKLQFLIQNKEKMNEISQYNYNYAKENVTNEVMAKRLHKELKDTEKCLVSNS